MAIELRHLRYFVAVAEEGHITRAAERLGIQQPPLSQLIKAIERELDAQLFRRKPRGVELTEAGRTFRANAQALLAQYERMFDLTRSAARGESGRLCIGVTPTGPFHPSVPTIIRAFRELYPRVTVTIDECLRTQLLEQLRAAKLDVAFLRASIAEFPDLMVHPLLVEPMIVALPTGHPLASPSRRAGVVTIKQLADETFIFYARQHAPAFYDATVAACLKCGFNPRAGQDAPRVTTALSLVGAGLGICVVPASLRRMNMEGVTYLAIKGSTRLQAVMDLGTRRHDPSPVVRRFVQLAKETAKSLALKTDIAGGR